MEDIDVIIVLSKSNDCHLIMRTLLVDDHLEANFIVVTNASSPQDNDTKYTGTSYREALGVYRTYSRS